MARSTGRWLGGREGRRARTGAGLEASADVAVAGRCRRRASSLVGHGVAAFSLGPPPETAYSKRVHGHLGQPAHHRRPSPITRPAACTSVPLRYMICADDSFLAAYGAGAAGAGGMAPSSHLIPSHSSPAHLISSQLNSSDRPWPSQPWPCGRVREKQEEPGWSCFGGENSSRTPIQANAMRSKRVRNR